MNAYPLLHLAYMLIYECNVNAVKYHTQIKSISGIL